MARIAVVTGGYWGDVLPFVPVARELSRRHHQVRMLVPTDFHAALEGEPFETPAAEGHDLGPAFFEQYGPFVGRWGNRLGGARVARLFLAVVRDRLEQIVEALEPHAEWADLLLVHPVAALSCTMPFERQGVPFAVGDLFPMLLPSAASPAVGGRNLGPVVNRLTWAMARSRLSDPLSYAPAFRAMRRRLGLPTDGWNLVDGRSSPHLNIGLASRHYVDEQPDWPQPYRLVGFTYWDGPLGHELPDDVRAFLDDGPAPVVVTLGTSAAAAHPELFTLVADALDGVGERGLFLTSTPGTVAAAADGRHGWWPFVPLGPLLGRCRAVVHSGAHGTNALALRAGLPSVVRPCLQDQVWHAHRQEQLGTGVAVRRNRFEPALRRALGDAAITERAAAIAERLATEDGAVAAADEVDRFLSAA